MMKRERKNPVDFSISRRLLAGGLWLGVAALAVTACNDIAPPFSITGTGGLEGLVFFDAAEDGIFDPSDGDFAVPGVGIAVQPRGTGSNIATVTSGADGRFTFADIPIGTHDLLFDTLTVPAGVVICQNPMQVTVVIGATRFNNVQGRAGCLITIAAAKDLPLGTFVVVRGVITATPGQVESGNWWIEDATAGAHGFSGALDAANLSVGDQVEIGAITGQFSNDFEFISPITVREVVAGFDPNPQPVLTTTGAIAASGADFTDPLQGAFVRLENVQFTVMFGGTAGGNIQNGGMDDGTGGAIIRIDDGVADRNTLNTIFTVGTCYNLNGFGANFAGSGQIFLRSLDDSARAPSDSVGTLFDFEEVGC